MATVPVSGNCSGEWQLHNPVYRLWDHLCPIGLHFGTWERDAVEKLKRKSDTKIRVIVSNLGVWKIHKNPEGLTKIAMYNLLGKSTEIIDCHCVSHFNAMIVSCGVNNY